MEFQVLRMRITDWELDSWVSRDLARDTILSESISAEALRSARS